MPVTMIRREKTVPNSIMRFCKVFYTDSKFSGIIKLKGLRMFHLVGVGGVLCNISVVNCRIEWIC